MAVILTVVPAQNNMSSKCFITFLNTTAQTERSGSNPPLLPRCLHASHPSFLRRKVARALLIITSQANRNTLRSRPDFVCLKLGRLTIIVSLWFHRKNLQERARSTNEASNNATH